MQERRIKLRNKRGLHARAASRLVQVASEFQCDVQVLHNEREADGKNIMSVLMLAAPVGSELTLRALGDDADTALDQLCELIDNRFDEDDE